VSDKVGKVVYYVLNAEHEYIGILMEILKIETP